MQPHAIATGRGGEDKTLAPIPSKSLVMGVGHRRLMGKE